MEGDEKLTQSCREYEDYVERLAVEAAAAERQRYGSSSTSSWHRPQPQQAEAWPAAPEALITVPTMGMDGKDLWLNNLPASSSSAPASIPSPLFASTAENWEGLAGGDALGQAATPQLDLALNSSVNGIESAGNPGLMMNAGLGGVNPLMIPQNDYAMIRARLHARLQEVMPEVSNDRRLVADIVEGYRPMAQSRRQRSAKKAIPDEQKDEQYYIRRARNNKAAKKSRDGRKKKEDGVMIAVTFLQQEQDDMEKKFAFLQQRIELLNEFGILKNRLMARRGPRRMDLNLPMPLVKSVPAQQSESPYLVRDKAKISATLMKGVKYSQMKKLATQPPQVMMQPHEELTLLEEQHLQQLLQEQQQQQQSQLLLKQLSPPGMHHQSLPQQQQQEPQLLQPELLGPVLPQDMQQQNMQQQQQQQQQERPPQQSDMLMKQLLPQEMQMHLKQEEQLHSQLMMQQMQAETMQPQKLQHQQYPQHEQQYQQQQPASLHEQQYQQQQHQQQQQEPSTPLRDQQLNLTVSLPSYF